MIVIIFLQVNLDAVKVSVNGLKVVLAFARGGGSYL